MISVITATGRQNPLIQDMADGLYAQLLQTKLKYPEVNLEWIVVDMLFEQRPTVVAKAVESRYKSIHVLPKPNLFQGKHRVTKKDLWAKASASNTGLIYADNPCVIFVDDCTLWVDGWLEIFYEAFLEGKAATGPYHYVIEGTAKILNGCLIEKEIKPGDHRLTVIKEPDACPTGWLWGGNTMVPLWVCIKTNGFDELHDSTRGLEDCEFAGRVGKLIPTWFYPDAGIYQITDTHESPTEFADTPANKSSKLFPYIDQTGTRHMMTKNHLPMYWAQGMNIKWNKVTNAYDVMADERMKHHKSRVTTLGNWFRLTDLRKMVRAGKAIPPPPDSWPTKDWRDQQELKDM